MLDLTDSLSFCMPLCSQSRYLRDSTTRPEYDDNQFPLNGSGQETPTDSMSDTEFFDELLGEIV